MDFNDLFVDLKGNKLKLGAWVRHPARGDNAVLIIDTVYFNRINKPTAMLLVPGNSDTYSAHLDEIVPLTKEELAELDLVDLTENNLKNSLYALGDDVRVTHKSYDGIVDSVRYSRPSTMPSYVISARNPMIADAAIYECYLELIPDSTLTKAPVKKKSPGGPIRHFKTSEIL